MGCGSTKESPVDDSASVLPVTKKTAGDAFTSEPRRLILNPDDHTAAPASSLQQQSFRAFIEFPTPHLLRDANCLYTAAHRDVIPRDNDGTLQPYPTPTGKSTVFNLDKYAKADHYALNISKTYYDRSIEEFADILTGPYRADEMAVARVVFRWLAAQDIDSHSRMQTPAEGTVSRYLHDIKDNNELFCDVFIAMCRRAGLQCHLVRGHTKHAHFEPGEAPSANNVNRWVALVINNQWRLVDPLWSFSHMVGGGSGEWLLIDDDGSGAKNVEQRPEGTAYSYNETYFLMDPEQYIYSHWPLPEHAQFQLLARPVTLQEFTDMAYLKPAFFDLDLRLLADRKCVMHATDGELDLHLGTRPGSQTGFMYRLWMSDKQSYNDIHFDQFCVLNQKQNQLSCRIYFPVAGKYKLELFAKDATRSTGGNFYQLACIFILHADKPAKGIKALPKNTRQEWGPGHDLTNAGLEPLTHDGAMVEADDGKVEMRFKYNKDVEMLAQLTSNSHSEDQLKGHVVHYKDEQQGQMVVKVTLPEQGDYALQLYAKDAGAQGSLQNVCNYIVSTTTSPTSPAPYPDTANSRLGPLGVEGTPRLMLISHDTPIIRCPDCGQLQLVFQASEACKLLHRLNLHANSQKRELENYIWMTQEPNNKITLDVNFPEPGSYCLELFAVSADSDKSTIPHVYTCVIDVPLPRPHCVTFPKKYGVWSAQCRLLEPLTEQLAADTEILVALVLPDACDVTTINHNNEWSPLAKGADGVWRGKVNTGQTGQLKLAARNSPDTNNYQTYVEYQVVGESSLKEEERRQKAVEEMAKKENEAKRVKQEQDEKRRLEVLERAKQAILAAIESRDIKKLRAAVKDAERQKLTSHMPQEVEAARALIKSLERIARLNKAVLDLDQKTMIEIKGYSSPPEQVYHVIVATLLLLGNSEAITKDWTECQKHLTTIGKGSLHRQIGTFQIDKLHPEIAARALEWIGCYRADDVREVSAGAAAFYIWTAGMIEEVRSLSPEAKLAPSANIKRQQEIFRGRKVK